MNKEIYRIAKWEETFETAESKRYKSLTWVSLPIGSSSGYIELVSTFGDEAPAIYGAWCALIRIAAQAPTRGTLASSKGKPYTFERLATESRFPAEVFRKLFDWATSEDVAWIEVIPITGLHPGDTQATNGQHPGYLTEPNLTKPNLTDLTEPDLAQSSQDSASQLDFEGRWEAEIQPVATSIRGSIDPGKRISKRNRELVLRLAAMSVFSPDCAGVITAKVDYTQERIAGDNPPEKRWGFFKDQVIRGCKSEGLNFDAMWDSIEIPARLLEPKKPPQKMEVADHAL